MVESPARGRAPRNCAEHKPTAQSKELAPEVLHCIAGDHDWSRENRRGRAPASCPEHRPEKAIRDPDAVSSAKRIEGIQVIMDDRGSCTCDLRADMTDTQLMRMRTCTESDGSGFGRGGWVCAVTHKIRCKYVDLDRQMTMTPSYQLED